MQNKQKRVDQTQVSTIVDDTVAEPLDAEPDVSSFPEQSMEQLAANFQAIIKAKAIYYPVAYRFGRELGRGRQGVVFLGYRHGARGCVTRHAIKLFTPMLYSTAQRYWIDMGRLANQISRLQSVNSPNLLARDAYEETNGIGYVQMSAIDGIDVHQLIYGNHFNIARRCSTQSEWLHYTDVVFRFEAGKVRIQPGIALYIMRQTLRGLEVLHSSGYMHSDVKPSNLMIDKLGIVKLIDYGRALQINEKMSFLFGTPVYMAPEVHRRENWTLQSDIYSVGLVGLELLRGEPLLDATDMTEGDLLEFKLQLPDKLPELVPPHVSRNPDFLQLLRRFLDPDPSKRYDNAGLAESANEGLAILHKQLAISGKDSEYDRELADYISKLFFTSDQDTNDYDTIMN